MTQSLLGVQAVILWWFDWSGHITVAWLVLLSLMAGAINAFDIPARQSLMIELVGREDVVDAIALNSSGFNVARVIGPALAAIVIDRLGLAWCFAINSVSFLLVLIGLSMIRLAVQSRASGGRRGGGRRVVDGRAGRGSAVHGAHEAGGAAHDARGSVFGVRHSVSGADAGVRAGRAAWWRADVRYVARRSGDRRGDRRAVAGDDRSSRASRSVAGVRVGVILRVPVSVLVHADIVVVGAAAGAGGFRDDSEQRTGERVAADAVAGSFARTGHGGVRVRVCGGGADRLAVGGGGGRSCGNAGGGGRWRGGAVAVRGGGCCG